jgi:hypothetical protein
MIWLDGAEAHGERARGAGAPSPDPEGHRWRFVQRVRG